MYSSLQRSIKNINIVFKLNKASGTFQIPFFSLSTLSPTHTEPHTRIAVVAATGHCRTSAPPLPALPGASSHVPTAVAAAARDPRLLLRDHRRRPWPLATSDGSLSATGSRRRICMYPSSQQRHLCVRAYPQPRQTQRRRSSDIAGSSSHRACPPHGERKVEFSYTNGYGERSEPWPKLAFEQVLTGRRTTARNAAATGLLRLTYAVSDRAPTGSGLAAPRPGERLRNRRSPATFSASATSSAAPGPGRPLAPMRWPMRTARGTTARWREISRGGESDWRRDLRER